MSSIRALHAHKLSPAGVGTYAKNMERNSDRKQEFFCSRIESICRGRTGQISILDVGCCSGELTGRIKQRFGAIVDIQGIDLSERMLALAKAKYPDIKFSLGNGYNLDFDDESFDIIICSSIIHELGSYYSESYSMDSYNYGIKTGLDSLKRILRHGGVLLVKDPVMPRNPENSVILSPRLPIASRQKVQGESCLGKCLKDMDYPERVAYFVSQFPWFSGRVIISGNEIICSKGDVPEIARHTSNEICDSQKHFTDELKEWYGSWNIEMWRRYVGERTDIELLEHRTVFSGENHSAEFYNHFDVCDSDKRVIIHKHQFPTHQFTELRKI